MSESPPPPSLPFVLPFLDNGMEYKWSLRLFCERDAVPNFQGTAGTVTLTLWFGFTHGSMLVVLKLEASLLKWRMTRERGKILFVNTS